MTDNLPGCTPDGGNEWNCRTQRRQPCCPQCWWGAPNAASTSRGTPRAVVVPEPAMLCAECQATHSRRPCAGCGYYHAVHKTHRADCTTPHAFGPPSGLTAPATPNPNEDNTHGPPTPLRPV